MAVEGEAGPAHRAQPFDRLLRQADHVRRHQPVLQHVGLADRLAGIHQIVALAQVRLEDQVGELHLGGAFSDPLLDQVEIVRDGAGLDPLRSMSVVMSRARVASPRMTGEIEKAVR